MPSAPGQPSDNTPKKPGFLSTLATAAREISAEVKRSQQNLPPSPADVGALAPSAAAASPVAAATPGVTGVSPLAQLASFQLDAMAEPSPLSPPPPAPAARGGDEPSATAAPTKSRILNPWPALRATESSRTLQADAYFHPYTPADVDFYSQGLIPLAATKQVISLIAVEAGETTMLGRMAQLFSSVPGVYGSIGFNPRNLQPNMDDLDTHLTTLLNQHPNLIAVGPVGIDANYSPSSLQQQTDQLVRQLEIAADFELPAIIFHTKALTDLQKALSSTVLPRRLVWLKPIREAAEIELIQQIDAYVVLRAELTHPKESFYQQAISQLLPQRLLIGSGNSLNAVHDQAGQFNSVASLPEILRVAAQLLGMAPAALQSRVNTNFAQVYGPFEG